jgi:NAD(P)-dependent dehydrogenase (short-subunit alcohol dehydrogenase family)
LFSAGQGFNIAEYLALNGAKVYLCGQTDEQARQAIKKFQKPHPDYKSKGKLAYLQLDLVDSENAVVSAEKILKNESRLDFLGETIE